MQNSNQPSSIPRRGRNPSQASSSTSGASAASTGGAQSAAGATPEDEIARRAYARWESSDRSHGRDQEHWFAAEEELRQNRNQSDPNRGSGADGS